MATEINKSFVEQQKLKEQTRQTRKILWKSAENFFAQKYFAEIFVKNHLQELKIY